MITPYNIQNAVFTDYTLKLPLSANAPDIDLSDNSVHMYSHSHDRDEIMVIMSGEMTLIANNRYYYFNAPCVIFIKAGCVHTQFHSDSVPYERYYYQYDKTYISEFLSEKSLAMQIHKDDVAIVPLSEVEAKRIGEIGALIYDTCKTASPDKTAVVVDIRAKLLFSCLIAEIIETEKFKLEMPFVSISPYLSLIMEYISGHFSEKLTIETLADKFFVSRAKLTHDFKKYVSMTIKEYVTRERIKNACVMIADGEALCAVAEKCGYVDEAYLVRIFKKKLGITPAAYREKLKKQQ